jgi:hypothetical protein
VAYASTHYRLCGACQSFKILMSSYPHVEHDIIDEISNAENAFKLLHINNVLNVMTLNYGCGLPLRNFIVGCKFCATLHPSLELISFGSR